MRISKREELTTIKSNWFQEFLKYVFSYAINFKMHSTKNMKVNIFPLKSRAKAIPGERFSWLRAIWIMLRIMHIIINFSNYEDDTKSWNFFLYESFLGTLVVS